MHSITADLEQEASAAVTRSPVINHLASYSDVRDGREIVAFVSEKTSKGSFTAAFGVFIGGKNSLKTEPEIYANRDSNSPIA